MSNVPKADEPTYDDPPYYRTGLVGCGKDKKDEAAPASELYTSEYFRLKRKWAETYCYRWFVVSAEHGLLKPNDEIEPYETALSGLSETGKKLWCDKLAEQMRLHLSTVGGTPHSHEVVLLMGDSGDNDYRTQVREALNRQPRGYFNEEDEHADVYSPFEEEPAAQGGQGNQMSWLKSEVEWAEKTGGDGQATVDAFGGEA